MNRQPVISSNVRSIGYDRTNGTLEVEFKNASVYQYFAVPEKLYVGLLEADSVGNYLHVHIKNAFHCERVI